MIFRTWDPQFLETWSLHSRFPRPKKTWEILGYGFHDMVFRTWDLNFGAWEIFGYGFHDMVFRTWDLNFGAWIFTLAVFTMAEGHEHPLISIEPFIDAPSIVS